MSFSIAEEMAKQLKSHKVGPRTIETVTEEILDIKSRVTENFMELGQRLCEAKEMLPHGEWLPWLEGRVQFSERTAQKFMALSREYESNPKLASDLGSEKAFALLSLPMEEREQIAREGVVVNGKTKPAADLTKREVQQVVREKKTPSVYEQSAQAYLDQRAEEDELFRELLGFWWKQFASTASIADARHMGVDALKASYKFAASGGPDGGWRGTEKGLEVYGKDRKVIQRTWTEVWDCLAVLALQEVSWAQPEGQLMICGWMPGGTTPREPCLCACMMDLGGDSPVVKVLWWDGYGWLFKKMGQEVQLEPMAWLALPEYEGGSANAES